MLLVRRIRYAMVVLAVVVVGYLLWRARGGFIPFLIGGVLAYLLTPLVDRVALGMPFGRRRPELARTLAIVLIYLVGASVLISGAALIIPAIVRETGELADNIPGYVRAAQDRAREWSATYRERVPADVQARIDESLNNAGDTAGQFGQRMLTRSFSFAQGLFSVILGYLIIPFWLFYILKDRHKIGPEIQRWFPPGIRDDVNACIRICQRVLGSYIRAQLTLGFFIGVVTTIGLWLLGIEGYIVLGIIAGLTELIPVLGPILGAIPALIVVLATEPDKFIWVLLFYVAVQQVENAILVPRIQGNAVNLHPALIIVLLVVAQQVAGFFGMVVVVPLAALVKDLYQYVYRRLREREDELARPQVVRLDRARLLEAEQTIPDEDAPATLVIPESTLRLPRSE